MYARAPVTSRCIFKLNCWQMNYVRSDKETKVLLLYTRKFQCSYEFGEPVKIYSVPKRTSGRCEKKTNVKLFKHFWNYKLINHKGLFLFNSSNVYFRQSLPNVYTALYIFGISLNQCTPPSTRCMSASFISLNVAELCA